MFIVLKLYIIYFFIHNFLFFYSVYIVTLKSLHWGNLFRITLFYMTWKVTLKSPENMTWEFTLIANQKYDLKSHSNSQPKNMTWKVTLIINRKFSAIERKREKFAGNASAEIWEGERKVEEMLLHWDKKKWRKGLSIYMEWNTIQVFTLSNVGLEVFFFLFFFKLSPIVSFVLTIPHLKFEKKIFKDFITRIGIK